MCGARGAPLGSGGLRPGAGRLGAEQDGAGLSPLVSASLLGLSSIALSGFATPRVQEFDSVGTWFLAARMEKPQKGKRQLIKFIHVVTARGRMHHASCMLSREIEIGR